MLNNKRKLKEYRTHPIFPSSPVVNLHRLEVGGQENIGNAVYRVSLLGHGADGEG